MSFSDPAAFFPSRVSGEPAVKATIMILVNYNSFAGVCQYNINETPPVGSIVIEMDRDFFFLPFVPLRFFTPGVIFQRNPMASPEIQQYYVGQLCVTGNQSIVNSPKLKYSLANKACSTNQQSLNHSICLLSHSIPF